MATRQALLIGAPGGLNSKFLPGVEIDLERTKEFLMSPRGGAWFDSEIIVLDNPNLSTITYAMQGMYADYTITLFSGHGFADTYGNRFLSLSDGNYFQDWDLLNQSPRQLVLIDACRKVLPAGIYGPPLSEEWYHFDGGESDLQRARKIYDRWIELSESGQVIIHSTKHDTYAYDTKDGGVFTQKLLQVGNGIPTSEKFGFSNIIKTGNQVPKLIRENGFSQQPIITYKNGNINLPFAMAMPRPKFISERTTPNKKPNYAGWFLGLAILGMAFSASQSKSK